MNMNTNTQDPIRGALQDLLFQVEQFCAKHGEADFETARAHAALQSAAAQQQEDDPCPGCVKGGVCKKPTCGRLKLPVDHPVRSGHPKAEQSPIVAEILTELERATRKFPTWPTDPLHALAVLGEEFGETTKAMLQLTYEPHKTTAAEVRTEAIQTAAMALRLAMSLNRYEYRRGEQHSQQDAAPPGLALVQTEPTAEIALRLTGYDLRDPGLSTRDRDEILQKARKLWASDLLAAAPQLGDQ